MVPIFFSLAAFTAASAVAKLFLVLLPIWVRRNSPSCPSIEGWYMTSPVAGLKRFLLGIMLYASSTAPCDTGTNTAIVSPSKSALKPPVTRG